MAVKLNTIKCPLCGTELPVEEGRKKVYCSYCGSEINISSETVKVYKHKNQDSTDQHKRRKKRHSIHEIDDYHLEMIDETAAEISRRDDIIFYTWLVTSVILLMIGMLCMSVLNHRLLGEMLLLLGAPITLGGAFYLFNIIPDKDRESLLIAGGGIRFPHNSADYKGEDYRTVVDSLKELGFKNFRYQNMGDVVIGLLQKPNKIERITIDGKGAVAGRIYFPDSKIKIIYHGKKK